MKKSYFFSAICLSAAFLSSCGGEAKQEQTAPAEAPVVWSNEMTYSANEVVKSKEVTNFGENDEVVSVDKYSIDKATNELVLAEHVIYQNGKPVYSNVLESNGTVIGHNVYTYNEAGNLTLEVVETYVEGLKRVAPSQRYVYEYNENGDVTVVKEQHTIPNGWATDYEWQYGYDAQQRLISRQDFNGDGKERKQSCQYGYSYKEGTNQLAQVDYYVYDLKTQRLRHDSKMRYEYTKEGRIKSETVIRHKANKTRDDINSRLITYTYTAAGQLDTRVEQKWNNTEKKWYDVRTAGCEYSESGQLLQNLETLYTNKGLRINKEIYAPVPEGKSLVAPSVPVEQVKPVVDVDDKHKTSKDED